MIVKQFILENWRLIVDILSVIIVTIFFFIKKKPLKIVDSVKTAVIAALPSIINRAENYKDPFDPGRKLSGQEKFNIVLSACFSLMVDELGVDPASLPCYTSWLTQHIEDILSTPQKKGEKHE